MFPEEYQRGSTRVSLSTYYHPCTQYPTSNERQFLFDICINLFLKLVDWITNEYLDEQYKGQRVLAHLITRLGKMMDQNGALGEDMIDKKLLLGEELVAASVRA